MQEKLLQNKKNGMVVLLLYLAALALSIVGLVFGIISIEAGSLGLGIPFVLSAVMIDYLKSAFAWIKRHYTVINAVSGGLLVVIGILMATGTLGRLLNLLS